MNLRSLLVCCCWLASLSAAEEREDGILYDHTSRGLWLWNNPERMRNRGYPNPSPHHLVQTWRYVGSQQPGEITALRVICTRVFVPPISGSDDCGDYKMTIKDGSQYRELCGETGVFTILSETNEIEFELHTGPQGGAIVNCIVQAVPVTSDRTVITTTTTTTPKPTQPAYQTLESYEVDSSEHGGEEGDKSTTCPCGWANKMMSRIVNGTETARNEFPFAAGLAYRRSRDRFCGATIITRFHALTAAHCTAGEKAKYLSLLVGIHNVNKDFDGPADEVPLEQIIDHENYRRGVYTDSPDISLLVMEREIKFGQFVGPACLPTSNPRLNLDRQYIKIIGWGAGYYKGIQSPVLQKVDVRVVPAKECNHMYSEVKVENSAHICTYARRKASCQGDSGGPVMWVDPETNRYTHVGIVSFGRICGDLSPSVHTNVQIYLDWIHQKVRASKPSAETCTKIN